MVGTNFNVEFGASANYEFNSYHRLCANIASMDNANGATIVPDIEYMSKSAKGTFICHEDPTC